MVKKYEALIQCFLRGFKIMRFGSADIDIKMNGGATAEDTLARCRIGRPKHSAHSLVRRFIISDGRI